MEELILANMLITLAPEFCDDGMFTVRPHYEISTNQGPLCADLFLGGLIDGHLVSAVVQCDRGECEDGKSELDLGLKRRGFGVIRFDRDDISNYPRSCALEVLLTMHAAALEREV